MKKEIIRYDDTFWNIDMALVNAFDIGALAETPLVYILSKTIPEEYQPDDNILAASVGCGNFINDAAVIKGFHLIRFGPKKQVYLVGIDIQPKFFDRDEYDLELRGEFANALTDIPWQAGLVMGNQEKYEYIQILNPDFLNSDWQDIYLQGLRFLSPSGILVTVCHKDDMSGLEEITSNLSRDNAYNVGRIRLFSEIPCFNSHSYRISY
ncbi:hypothetical protein GF323_05225 [Candidatus Woesearchaeota archaeon]|nr:hypothetical protein [Candidatus Woesearchaeota archaeon]